MLPAIRSRNAVKEYKITSFGGINSSFSQKSNEFGEGYNLSSRNYPALSSAKTEKQLFANQNNIVGGGFYNNLYTVEHSEDVAGKAHIYKDQSLIYTFTTDKTQKRKMEFIKDGFFVIPDNVVYHIDTEKLSKGNVSETTTKESALTKYQKENPGSTELPNPDVKWYSAELTPNALTAIETKYSSSGESYVFYNFRLSGSFKVGDIITLSMEVNPLGSATASERQNYISRMSEPQSFKIKDLVTVSHKTPSGRIAENTQIIFEDNTFDMDVFDQVLVTNITIEKSVPDFNDICSFENRMWGVTDTEICASKLADCTVWEDFTADQYGTLPSSSFRTEVESDGKFTAVTAYNGNILAFKEDCIHKIFGREPAEYKLTRINCPGVESGCRDTVAVAGGILFYKTKNGIYAHNGSSFRLVSENTDINNYEAICASGDERYYYISVSNEKENAVFVYDTRHGIWNKLLISQKVNHLVKSDEDILGLCDNEIIKLNEGDYGNWSFTLSFGKKDFASKHICSVFARYSLSENGRVKIQMRNSHDTYDLYDYSGPNTNYPLRITIPVSCARDSDLIFSGSGEFTLISLTVRYKETGIND